MDSQTFNTIENKLLKLVIQKNDLISTIKKNSKVPTWTIEELKNRVGEARKIQSSCDSFFKSDLYHLLGMGNLTVSQTNKLLKLTRNLGKDRSIVKGLSGITTNNTFDFNIKDFKKDIAKPSYTSNLLNITLK